MSPTVMPVIAAILLIVSARSGLATELDLTLLKIGTASVAMPFVTGSIIDIVIEAWNELWDESEEVTWLEAEREVIERLVDRFSGFAGVWLEDGDGNEIDVDDLAHPNAPDGGMDCILIVDAGEYTTKGFQATCTRVLNIIIDGDY
jgi:hypothetical protein